MARDNDQIVFGHERLGKIYPKGMLKSLETKEEKIIHYNKQKIPFGITKLGKIYYLDLSMPLRAACVGLTRSGKTWILRGLSDRLNYVGYSIVWLTDVKNEAWTSSMPLQQKFHHLLLEGEKPRRMKIVSFRPTFFKPIDKGVLPERNKWLSLNPARMTKTDFLTLLATEGMTEPQKV